MKELIRHAFCVLVCPVVPLVAQSPCTGRFTDSLSIRTLQAFDRVAEVAPVWDDYGTAGHTILMIGDPIVKDGTDTSVCAALWRHGKPLEPLELPRRPAFSTPLYGMFNIDSTGARSIAGAQEVAAALRAGPPEIATALKARGVTRALILDLPLRFDRLGRLGEALRLGQADPALISADLAVHEGFHLHVQYPTWLDQRRAHSWPPWDLQPDRAALRQRCYTGSEQLTSMLAAEHQALLDAFDALEASRLNVGLRHARRFVDLRLSRRQLQGTTRIPRGLEEISCALAEDIMELEEGVAQWTGHATTARAGLTTIAALRPKYAATQAEWFYQTGPLQLWVLGALLGPVDMARVTSSIARSTSADGPGGGLFAQFDVETRRLLERQR